MPLIAKHATTGERLDITTVDRPRQTWMPGDIICPLCGGGMIVKAGLIKIPHFAHRNICTTDYKCHPESAEHIAGKMFVAKMVKEHTAEWQYEGHSIEFEYPVKEIKRVIDVALLFPSGWIIAHEVQLAGITTEELQERTDDYLRAGIDVIWWLGNNANTPSNSQWLSNRYGAYHSIHFTQSRNRRDQVLIGEMDTGMGRTTVSQHMGTGENGKEMDTGVKNGVMPVHT